MKSIPVALCGLRFTRALNTSDSVRYIASSEFAGMLNSSGFSSSSKYMLLVNTEKKYWLKSSALLWSVLAVNVAAVVGCET